MGAPAKIIDLIDRFYRNANSYRSEQYNETQVRREFIDPFFNCLGWDVDNTQGFAEAYKDVIHEDAIKIGGQTKAPDYSFRIGGTRKFFLEAKRPLVNLKIDPVPAFQLRRYAWSARLPLSILTDFEEFAVYDCRVKPAQTDKASAARIRFLTFTEYAEQWDSIAEIFSKEAVLKGSFDKFAEKSKLKKGTATVDAAFLQEIESWRELLAKNIALRNDLSQRELNYAVQVTIDRILFLRMCEDRGVEAYGQLAALRGGDKVYPRLKELFQRADQRYNSGLFHFERERDRPEPPDELTTALAIDDKPLKEIFKGLYYPESPYEFSVLPAEILGQVYEQFLGKVIRLTSGHRAVVEEKPEVRKAGGVYYTPTYIVDYIVKNTVGKLLEGKTPKQASKLKFVDPACGSGSFLLGAYQFLLDWHRDRYIADDPEKHPKELFQGPGGAWHLTSAEKKRILLNNIYGVDIDAQAVEVTKLSLLLKVLEGESQQTLELQYRLFHERALPDLSNNIKCGNSLIGPDFYEGRQTSMLDEEESYRINVFDWNAEFAEIMKAGGFDAVIGNPPYVRQEGVSDFKAYLSNKYESYDGLADLYVYFFERGVRMLKKDGYLCYICSGKFAQAGYGEPLRRFLSRHQLISIVDYGDAQIFYGATTYPIIAVVQPRDALPISTRYGKATANTGLDPSGILDSGFTISKDCLGESPWAFIPKAGVDILAKLTDGATPLKQVAGPAQLGIKTSLNEAFVIDADTASRLIEEDISATSVLKPYLRGRDVTKWSTVGNGTFLVCAKESLEIRKFPSILKHLQGFERKLRDRYEVKRGDYDWWVIRQVARTEIFDHHKIVYPDLCSRSRFALNTDGAYPNNTLFCIPSEDHSLLSFLNSRLAWYWITKRCPSNRGGAYRLFNQYLNELPVSPKIVGNSLLSENCKTMVALHSRLLFAKTPHEKKRLEIQIAATDRQIDNLVYDLYGLTADEIKIVEQDGVESSPPTTSDDSSATDTNGDAAEYVPYQPALDAGISPEMDRLNFRRLQLAKRKSREGLTREEETEFERLQATFSAYVDTVFPRPSILDDKRLAELEKRFGNAQNS